MPRAVRKAPAPSKPAEPPKARKAAKRSAEDNAEDKVVPSKRTALGKAKQPTTVNGLNNNGPLDDQPALVSPEQPPSTSSKTSRPGGSKAKPGTSAVSLQGAASAATPATLYCFGSNDCGQLGLSPDVEKRKFPALVESLKDKKMIDVACGGMHTLALQDNGTVWSFGVNDDQALGRKTEEEEDGFEPGIVGLAKGVKVKQISAGDSHSAALTADGQVYIWGCFKDSNGNFGLVPVGDEICRQKPENITADLKIKFVKISSGAHHLALLSEDGHLFTCGTGDQGQLGRKQLQPKRVTRSMGLDASAELSKKEFLLKPTLVKVGRNPKIVDIWTGEYATYCRTSNDEIYVFGLNNYSQLGIPNKNSKKTVIAEPTKTTNFKGKQWLQIAAGQHHTVALDSDGKVYTLGRKSDGRLGLEFPGDDESDSVDSPTLVPQLSSIKCQQVGAGGSTSYAITSEGHLYSWGFGENWQLATGEDTDEDQPKRCCSARDTPLEGAVRVTAGGQHVAITVLSR